MTNIGDISLELVISSKINEQLERIKKDAAIPAEKLGDDISKKISERMNDIRPEIKEIKLPDIDSSAAEKGIEKISDIAQRAQDRYMASLKEAEIVPKAIETKAYLKYDTSQIEEEIAETESRISSSFDGLSREIRERLGTYDIPDDPVKRLQEEINNTYFKLDLLQKKWQELSYVEADDKISSQLQSVQAQIISTTKTLDRLEDKLEKIKPPEIPQVETPDVPDKKTRKKAVRQKVVLDFDDYEKIDAAIEKISGKIKGTFSKLASPVSALGEKIRETFTKAAVPVSELGGKIKGTFSKAAAPVSDLASKVGNTFGRLSSSAQKFGAGAGYVFSKVKDRASADLGKIAGKFEKLSAPVKKFGSGVASVFGKLKVPVQKFGSGVASVFGKLKTPVQKFGSSVIRSFDKLKGPVQRFGKTAVSDLGKLKTPVAAFGKSAVKTFGGLMSPVKKLASGIKTAFKSAILMAGIYAAFRALKDGFAAATKADKQFAKSLNEVKANLAIAFVPVMQSVMPMLNTLMTGLASVTRSVAGFISGLFGKTFKQSAEAAKKLQETSAAAKKAKLSMAGIDEMNVLSSDDSIDFSKIDMTEPELPDWAEHLKSSIISGDWSAVGGELADRVNAVISSIPWDTAREKVNGGIKKLTDLINGFTDKLDWGLIGDNLGEGVNTAFSAVFTFFDNVNWGRISKGITTSLNRAIKKTDWKLIGKTFGKQTQSVIDIAYEFVTGFDWSRFGKSIGDSVNSWFDNVDFGKAGRTLSGAIKGIFDSLIGFVQQTDWRQIGQKIAEFVSNIDYAGIASKLFELLGSAIGAAVSLVWGAIEKAVYAIRDYFSGKIEECGGNIVDGLWKGIKDAFSGAYKWLKDNVFKPFIDGFKKCFDIHSPSKVMAELGGYIIDGLKNAVVDGIKKIREVFTEMREKIKNIFSAIDKWFGEKFGSAWTKIKSIFLGAGNYFSDRWHDIRAVFSSVNTWFGEKFSSAFDKVKDAFKSIGTWFGSRWTDIKNVFATVGSWFSDRFSAAYDNVTRIWSSITDFFSGLWDDVANGALDGVNWIIDQINGLLGAVEDGINFIVDGINNLEFKVPDALRKVVSDALGMYLPDSFGLNVSWVDIPEIPHLAKGGIAMEPTLAMIGDNKNARTDPEVVAPLSKLQGMSSDELREIIELLKIIVELLKNGIRIENVIYMFKNSDVFRREILKVIRDDKIRSGG